MLLSILQEHVDTLHKGSYSVCESLLGLGHHDGYTAWPRHLFATKDDSLRSSEERKMLVVNIMFGGTFPANGQRDR